MAFLPLPLGMSQYSQYPGGKTPMFGPAAWSHQKECFSSGLMLLAPHLAFYVISRRAVMNNAGSVISQFYVVGDRHS